MSVWKTACYRDDPLQWYLRSSYKTSDASDFVSSLCDFEIGDFGDFPVPDGVFPGNFKNSVKQDPEVIRRIQTSDPYKPSRALTQLATEVGDVCKGIQATYLVAVHILRRADFLGGREFTDGKFLEHLVKYGFAASSHSAGDYSSCKRAIDYLTSGKFAVIKEAVRELVRLRGYFKTNSYAAEIREAEGVWEAYPEIEGGRFEFFKNFKKYSFPGAVLLKDEQIGKAYLLLSSDIERIDKICSGIHLSFSYLLAYGRVGTSNHNKLLNSYNKMFALFIDAALGAKNHNKVCRAFDVAYHYMLAKHIAVDDTRAATEQRSKFYKEGLHDILDLNTFTSICTALPPKEAIEVAMFYRCLPQPDFDYFSAAKRQYDMYTKNSTDAIRDRAAQGEIFDAILLYHRWTLLYAFWKAHGHCPGFVKEDVEHKDWHDRYPFVKATDIDFSESEDINFNGEFTWKGRTTDIIDLVNDKATCPKNLRDEHFHRDVVKMPVSDRNQLVDVMFREIPINLETLGQNRSDMNYDVKADDKPESKKPDGRWFFEAMTEPRLKQSEYEDSVSIYAKHVVGCFSGKSHADKVRQMNAVSETIAEGVPLQALFVSFDIEKFSPYLPIEIHKKLDAQWAEAFGIPDIAEASKIFTEGKVHYVKGCIHHSFQKFGVDFEGFAGKKLTVYHCAVMGYVARSLRVNGITTQSCRFAALIDDGLLRVVLPTQNFATAKDRALRLIERIYKKAALRISWDKTYASCVLSVFLHEIRIAGRSITPGLRAILKVTNRSDAPNPSMLDDLLHLRSTVSGAMVAGATPVSSYIIYLYHVYDLVKKWAPKHDSVRHAGALHCFIPIQMGGLGVESMNSLGGSISHTQLADCIGRLKLIGYRYVDVREAIKKLLGVSMHGRSGIAGVINPGGAITDSPHLRNDRLQLAIERNLMGKVSTPVFQALSPVLEAGADTLVNSVTESRSVVPVPLREVLYAMTPHSMVRKIAAKFLRARSAKSLVKASKFRNINYANIRDAERVLKPFVR